MRIFSKVRESIFSEADHLALHNQIRELKNGKFRRLQQLFRFQDQGQRLIPDEDEEFKTLKDLAEKFILRKSQIICTTCIGASDKRLRKLFKRVIIDESNQALEPESLIPLLHQCRHLVIAGDLNSLSPMISSKDCIEAGFKTSMFERLIKNGNKILSLSE